MDLQTKQMTAFLLLVYLTACTHQLAQAQQRGGFDFASFQRTLENGCKCGKAFYSGSREDQRLSAVHNCLRAFPEVPPYDPQVPVESECPQAAISTYARLNAYTKWRRESFPSPEAGAAYDRCVYDQLRYSNPDGSVNQQAFQKDITAAYLEEPSLNRDKDALLLLQSVLQRAKSPVCTEIREVEEYIRCSMKPCFGTAAVPKL